MRKALRAHHRPVGWELVRVEQVEIDDEELEAMSEEDLTALAAAVSEAGRVTTGLVETGEDPIEYEPTRDFNDPATSNHPCTAPSGLRSTSPPRRRCAGHT